MAVAGGAFSKQMTLNVDLDISKVNIDSWQKCLLFNICAKFHENRTFTFREMATSVTDQRTSERTNSIDHSRQSSGGENRH